MARFQTPAAEESVGCNLIPMIDIMFLLLLFFMLGADMTQHELAEVVLPEADQAKKDLGASGPVATVNVVHRSAAECPCETFALGGTCEKADHWTVDIHGRRYAGAALSTRLAAEADRERETQPGANGRRLSARNVTIRADRSAPTGVVRDVFERCAAVGLYRVSVDAAMTPQAK